VEAFAFECRRVDEVVHDRQRPIDRVGLLVYTHEEIRETRLDLALAVATAVVFHEERVRERSELSGLGRCRAGRLDPRDGRRRLVRGGCRALRLPHVRGRARMTMTSAR